MYHGRSQRQMGNYIQEVVRLVKCTNYQQRSRKRASRSGKNIRCQVVEETLRLDESFKSSLTITEDTVSEEVTEEAVAVEVSGRQAIGILKIKIDRAKGLQSGGWLRSNDPYVIVLTPLPRKSPERK